jgi:signal transduction histidine kinase
VTPRVSAPEYSLLDLFGTIQAGEKDTSKLLESCARLFHADGASLFLSDPLSGAYVLAAAHGTGKRIPNGTQIDAGIGIAGRALESGHVVKIDGAHPSNPYVNSSLVVPLVVRGSLPVGALNLSRGADADAYEQEDVKLAEAVATTLAFLFENALLVQRLESSHKRLQAILSGLSITTLLFDADGNLIAAAHPGAEDALHNPRIQATIASLRNEASLKGNVARFLLQSESTPQDLEAIDIAVVPLPEGGYAVTLEDVTREVQLQRSLEQNRRLAEIGQMTATVAHEIRNPLTSLRAVGQVLAEGSENAEFGTMIQEEVDKLSELCDQFLDFAKPVGLVQRPTDLQSLLAGLVQSCQADASAAGVHLSLLQAPTECGFEERNFCLDPRRVEQAARNLVLNGIQATPSGGAVSVILEPHGFSVEDTGRGIPPDLMGRLFTPFFTTKPKGTGLGLCTVKKIMEAHGGSISVETAPTGTRFTVVLSNART